MCPYTVHMCEFVQYSCLYRDALYASGCMVSDSYAFAQIVQSMHVCECVSAQKRVYKSVCTMHAFKGFKYICLCMYVVIDVN